MKAKIASVCLVVLFFFKKNLSILQYFTCGKSSELAVPVATSNFCKIYVAISLNMWIRILHHIQYTSGWLFLICIFSVTMEDSRLCQTNTFIVSQHSNTVNFTIIWSSLRLTVGCISTMSQTHRRIVSETESAFIMRNKCAESMFVFVYSRHFQVWNYYFIQFIFYFFYIIQLYRPMMAW